MFYVVTVHQDGATASHAILNEQEARDRFNAATQSPTVVYAHWSEGSVRGNWYCREEA